MNNSFAALVWAISVDGSSLHGWMTLFMSHLLALVAMVLCSQISAYTAQHTHSASDANVSTCLQQYVHAADGIKIGGSTREGDTAK